jgi:hypothetical protein
LTGQEVPSYCKIEYITDIIDAEGSGRDSKRLASRTRRYISHLVPSYLATLTTEQLVYQIEDFRIILHHLRPVDGWHKAPWGLHSSLRYTWSGIARVMDELDKRGEAENLLRPEEFDGILQSLMIYHPKTASPGSPRRKSTGRNEGNAKVEFQAMQEEGELDAEDARQEPSIDQYTTLTVPIIFHLISLTGQLPTHKQLLHLARSTSLTVLPSTPHAQAQRTWAAVTHLDIARASDTVWTRRRDMMESILDLWPGFAQERLYEEEIIQGVDECDILLHGNLAAMTNEEVDRLREGVAYWTTKRAAIYTKKRADVAEAISLRHKDMPSSGDGSGWAPNIGLGRDIAWLIRDSLVAFKLRHQSAEGDIHITATRHMDIKPGGVPGALSDITGTSPYDLDNPLDLFRLLLTVLISPDQSTSPASPGAIKVIVSCVIRLRNAFFHNRDLDSLLALIHVLGIPPTRADADDGRFSPSAALRRQVHALRLPALPSEVHATLLCAGHHPTPTHRFRQLVVALHHLPVPSTPLHLGSYTRRYLNFVARECDRERRYTSRDPSSPFTYGRADDDVRERHRTGGWRSVLQGLYVKWGEGYSVDEWELRQKVIAADRGEGDVTLEERSRLKAIKRQVAATLLTEDYRVAMMGKGDNILVRPKPRAH